MNGWFFLFWGAVLVVAKYFIGNINHIGFNQELLTATFVYGSVMILYGLYRLTCFWFQIGKYDKPQFMAIDGWLIIKEKFGIYRFVKNFDIPRPWGFMRQLLVDFKQPGPEIYLVLIGPALAINGIYAENTRLIIFGLVIMLMMANTIWKAGGYLRKGKLITHRYRNLINKSRSALKSTKKGDSYDIEFQLDNRNASDLLPTIKTKIEISTLKSLATRFSDIELLLLVEPGKKKAECIGLKGI